LAEPHEEIPDDIIYVEEAERNRAEDVRQKKESKALLEKQALRQKEEEKALMKKKPSPK